MTNPKMQALMSVGAELVDSTEHTDAAVVRVSTTIALFVEQRRATGLELTAGDGDFLPAMYKALGSSLEAMRDNHAARLAGFGLARQLGLIRADITGPACPCGEGPSGEAKPTLTVVAGGSESHAA